MWPNLFLVWDNHRFNSESVALASRIGDISPELTHKPNYHGAKAVYNYKEGRACIRLCK